MSRTTVFLSVLLWLAIGATVALLTGCGGGGDDPAADDEHTALVGPVDCRAHPELCQ